jgi:hypothetical protein
VRQSLEKYGARPEEHVDALGVFDVLEWCVAAHCLAIDETDTAILPRRAHVPHCPITYMKRHALSPAEWLAAGVRVALGTDGPVSNSDLDMFATLRQTALIHYQALDLALSSRHRCAWRPARPLGFQESGALEIGAPADLILVDGRSLRPLHSLVANLALGQGRRRHRRDGRGPLADAIGSADAGRRKILRGAESHAGYGTPRMKQVASTGAAHWPADPTWPSLFPARRRSRRSSCPTAVPGRCPPGRSRPCRPRPRSSSRIPG